MDTKLLDKWLEGTHTAEDLAILETYPEFSSYQKIDAYAKKIEIPAFNAEAGLQDVIEKLATKPQSKPKVRKLPMLLKVAAVLVVIAASYVFINSLPTTIQTQLTETKSITLPDTSEVILNGNSELSYNENNWPDARELHLNGEAYFKVAKGEKFTVTTTQGEVAVLGTQFNVSNTSDQFSVSCYEGLVAVTHNELTIQLEKGKSAHIVDGSLQLSEVYTTQPEWIHNESSYDNIRIIDVLSDFETTYNTSVTTKNIDVTLRYTGSYTHKDMEAALQTITIPLGLTYTIENDTSIIISPAKTTE
jgi:transmembrane sensor